MNPRDGLTYQWIPPGSYFTGCLPGDSECYGLERHREKIVVASGFWIGRTEVTQAAYMRVVNTNPSYYKGADLPADRVGWTDATTYCNRIGMRLPTESDLHRRLSGKARGGSCIFIQSVHRYTG